MMKLFFISILLLFSKEVNAQIDPIVMEINGKPVAKSEFLQIYLKNNNNPKYDK